MFIKPALLHYAGGEIMRRHSRIELAILVTQIVFLFIVIKERNTYLWKLMFLGFLLTGLLFYVLRIWIASDPEQVRQDGEKINCLIKTLNEPSNINIQIVNSARGHKLRKEIQDLIRDEYSDVLHAIRYEDSLKIIKPED